MSTLREKIETHVALGIEASPGFFLSADDLQEIARGLRTQDVADACADALRHMNAVITDEGGFRSPNGMIARKMSSEALDAYLALFRVEQSSRGGE